MGYDGGVFECSGEEDEEFVEAEVVDIYLLSFPWGGNIDGVVRLPIGSISRASALVMLERIWCLEDSRLGQQIRDGGLRRIGQDLSIAYENLYIRAVHR